MKNALVLGGGGFMGGHLAKRLKNEGFWVRVVDIKESHEFWKKEEICHEYISGDLRNPKVVESVFDESLMKFISSRWVVQIHFYW